MTERGICRCLQDNLKADNFTQSCKAEVQRYEQTASTDYRSVHASSAVPVAQQSTLVSHCAANEDPVTQILNTTSICLGKHCTGYLLVAATWHVTSPLYYNSASVPLYVELQQVTLFI